MSDYYIETKTKGSKRVFLTSARNPVSALRRLLNNSFDFKSVKNEDGVINIKIKRVSNGK